MKRCLRRSRRCALRLFCSCSALKTCLAGAAVALLRRPATREMPCLEVPCCEQKRFPTADACSLLCAGLAGAGATAVDGAAGGAAEADGAGESEAGHARTGKDLRPIFPPPAALQPQWLERLQNSPFFNSLLGLNREMLCWVRNASHQQPVSQDTVQHILKLTERPRFY